MYSYLEFDFDAVFMTYIVIILSSIAIYFLAHLIINAVSRWKDGS
ncbi:hypothetical protein [Alkalibacillus silvisoli]